MSEVPVLSEVVRLGSGGPWEDIAGYSRVVAAGGWILTAGCTATVDGAVVHPGDATAQARVAFGIALDSIARAGGAAGNVVRTRMDVVDPADADAVIRVHGEFFGAVRPAATIVVVAALLHPDHLVEVEVEAFTG